MALWLVSRICWISVCAIVTFVFHGIEENDRAKYLKEIRYLVKSADPETLTAITVHEVVSTTMKDLPEFASLGVTDPPSPSDDDDDDVADVPDICEDAKFDTVTEVKDGRTYAFKGDLFWKVGSCNIPSEYPKSISAEWDGLPGNLDASFTYSNGKTYFFKGSQYWRFVNKRMDKGYPRLISEQFPGIPDNVEAAIVWRGDEGKVYFFKGTEYWCFDWDNYLVDDSRYPRPIREGWSSLLANGTDAAFYSTARQKYFFFKDEKYYRYNAEIYKVDEVFPPYPLPTAAVWFGCY